MKLKLLTLSLLFSIVTTCLFADTGSFNVDGDFDKFYPVTFTDGGYDNNASSTLELCRSSVHENSLWRGALMSKFTFHGTNWGNGANYIDADIQYNQYPFIAGWRDASNANNSRNMLIWLRGGGTTYYYKSNYPITISVYDGTHNALPFNELNGPQSTYKTTIDPYVNSNGTATDKTAYFNGTGESYFNGAVGIGTPTAYQKLDINGGIGFANNNSEDKKLYSPEDGVLEWMTHNLAGNHGFAISHQGAKAVFFNTSGNSYINAGNVGIGTTSPTTKLDVNGDIKLGQGNFLYQNNSLGVATRVLGIHSSNYMFIGGLDAQIAGILFRTSDSQQRMLIDGPTGNVGIGTTDTRGYKLAVAGNIIAEQVNVMLQANWPDYVFKRNYNLTPLSDLKAYIDKNHHLPEVPSAQQVADKGLNLGEMNKILVKKVEELTLYLIALKAEKDKNEKEQKEKMMKLEQRLTLLESCNK